MLFFLLRKFHYFLGKIGFRYSVPMVFSSLVQHVHHLFIVHSMALMGKQTNSLFLRKIVISRA